MSVPNPFIETSGEYEYFEELRDEFPDWVLDAVIRMSRYGMFPGESAQELEEAAAYILNAYTDRKK